MNYRFALVAIIALITAGCSLIGSDSAGGQGDATASPNEGAELQFGAGEAVDVLNVAYFPGWPLPPQIGQADGSFAEAVGVDEINWVSLGSGGEMADAMLAGDVDVAYSMGLTPFANRVNEGADFTLVGVAVSYAEADNCVAQSSLGLTRENAAQVLRDKKVITPIGNVTHFKMLSMMEFLGVDIDSLEVIPSERANTAEEFAAGEVAVACAFGGPLVDMLANGGEVLLTGAETETEIGIRTYDIIAIPTEFGRDHPSVVSGFLKATNDFNERWKSDPAGNNPVIAEAAEMENVGNFLDGDVWFQFPTLEEQLSTDWLGSNVADTMRGQLATFERQGQLEFVLDDFSPFIDTKYLEAAR